MKYSAEDIHTMREALYDLATFRVSYNHNEVMRNIESQLVTYMFNETTAEELCTFVQEQKLMPIGRCE